MKFLSTIAFVFALLISARGELNVFAASSLTEVMRELAETYEEQGGGRVRFNLASSGALARQIDAGAPADVYISANVKWMDWLADRSMVDASSRINLAANTLVLVAPKGSALAFDGRVRGRIAVGNFKSVPAGIYAQEALIHMGWLEDWRPRLVMSSNVRTALLYVQRGEVDAGIVYATDAQAAGLPIIGTFPPESHTPIVYPAATVSEKESAFQFLAFLKSDKAKAIFKKHGFSQPVK